MLLKIVSSVLFSVLILIFSLPSLLSTSIGKKYVAIAAELYLGGKLEIESVNLCWLGNQEARNITWQKEEISLSIRTLRSDTPLWKLFFAKSFEVEELEGNLPRIHFQEVFLAVHHEDGKTSLRTHGKTTQGTINGVFNLVGELPTLEGKITNFPIALLEPFFPEYRLKELFGDRLDASFIKSTEDQNHVQVRVTSSQIEAEAFLEIQEGFLRLTKPGYARLLLFDKTTLDITLERFQMALSDQCPDILVYATLPSINLKEIEFKQTLLRVEYCPGWNSARMALSSDVKDGNLYFEGSWHDGSHFVMTAPALFESPTLRIVVDLEKDLHISLSAYSSVHEIRELKLQAQLLLGETISLKSGATVEGTFAKGKHPFKAIIQKMEIPLSGNLWEGSFELAGTIAEAMELHLKLADKQAFGSLHGQGLHLDSTLHENGDLQVKIHGKEVPLKLFDIPLLTALGKKGEIDATIDRKDGKSEIFANVATDHASAKLSGTIENGLLTLKEDLGVTLMITPGIIEKIIHPYAPVLSSVLKGENRLKLTIGKEKTTIPVTAFDIRQVNIGAGTLELDHLTFGRSGTVAEMFGQLTSRVRAKDDPFTIWFTPIHFSVTGGFLQLERVDLLVDQQFPIALWGKIDIPDDSVRLTVGLLADTLRHAFSINGIDSEYTITLLLKGPLAEPSIDKGKAIAKITTLAAQLRGGPHGAILGTLIDTITGNHGSRNVPPPTTTPFPWESTPQPSSLLQKILRIR